MKHFGNIMEICGENVPVVDCVIGGSPCQDLSVAGKRAGLCGERSSLYFEQIRIIKEMRSHEKRIGRTGADVRPRYMVWENVPGAISSNGGEDFRIVLEEAARVADPDVVIPRPAKWKGAGCIMADRWSIAWRILDAQFWGVPQRRRRIALVADFGGQSAPEILFVRESVSGDSEASGEKRKAASRDAEDGTAICDREREIVSFVNRGHYRSQCSETIRSNCGRDIACVVYRKRTHPHNSEECQQFEETDKADTLNAFDNSEKRTPILIVEMDRAAYNQGKNAQFDIGISENGIAHTVVAKGPGAVAYPQMNCEIGGNIRYKVRRMTPLECERLQGYPDGWTDIGAWVGANGKKHDSSDSARYRALGNSIALPQWKWVIKRLCSCYERDATMASLFDGIGGFPFLWEQINGKGSCLWASEIEEFPIAVTKKRIGE